MNVIDAQLHIWEPSTRRSWDGAYPALDLAPAFPLEEAVATMNASDVWGALLDVLPAYRRQLSNGSWEYDNSYAYEAIRAHPGRFCSTLRIDPRHPDVVSLVRAAAAAPEILALRVVFRFPDQLAALDAGEYDALLRQAEQSGLPVMLFITGNLGKAAKIAAAYPSNLFIIDHLGLAQPPRQRDEPPFILLPQLLALAKYDNLAVKCIGAPALSQLQFPFRDVWEPLSRIIESFGPARVMWGSDYTRLRHLFGYSEMIDFLREGIGISQNELHLLLGGALLGLLGWPATEAG